VNSSWFGLSEISGKGERSDIIVFQFVLCEADIKILTAHLIKTIIYLLVMKYETDVIFRELLICIPSHQSCYNVNKSFAWHVSATVATESSGSGRWRRITEESHGRGEAVAGRRPLLLRLSAEDGAAAAQEPHRLDATAATETTVQR